MDELIGKKIESIWKAKNSYHLAFVCDDGSTICYEAEGD
jgi:hypothetical protein